MPAVKAARPLDIFTREEWQQLTLLSPWRGLWLIAHGWIVALIAAAGAALAWDWHWTAGLVVTPLAIAIIGGRQLGLSILMHEAAHGLTHPKRSINNFAGQWLAATATGSDLHAYRSYHLTHHKYTQQPEDPDLSLSAPFPASPASMRRKIIRDLTGQTFFKQRSGQFAAAWTGLRAMLASSSQQHDAPSRDTSAGRPFNAGGAAGISAPIANLDGAKRTTRTVARFLLVQSLLLALALVTIGIVAWLVWIAALATSFQLALRIRNIAEHACTPTGSGDPFSHARTTQANWLERTLFAPYWVNYHAEHHLFMGVPCYQLHEAHRLLIAKGYGPRMTIENSYGAVMRTVTQPT
ncbi:MAG: fatty acid desaturase [Parasphingorhabdus sp.]|nr:fatty acid desaturase [Parasphingorhabdus sp.]